MHDPDDIYRERSRRLARRPVAFPFATGTPAMAGYVTSVPTVANPFVAMNPVIIGGDEVEGGPFTRDVSTDTLIFAGVGKKPLAGADTIAGFFPSRWAALRTDPFCDPMGNIKLSIAFCYGDTAPPDWTWHVTITRDGVTVDEGDTTYTPPVGSFPSTENTGIATYVYPVPRAGTYVVTATKSGYKTQTYTLDMACGGSDGANVFGVADSLNDAAKCSMCFGTTESVLRISTMSGTYDLTPQYDHGPDGPAYVRTWHAAVVESDGSISTYDFGCFGDANPSTYGDCSPFVVAAYNDHHCTSGIRGQWTLSGSCVPSTPTYWWTNPSRPYPAHPINMSFTFNNFPCSYFAGTVTVYEP